MAEFVLSWWRNWLNGLLSYLGFSGKRASILFLGLANAGKTTLMGVLTTDRVLQNLPTQHVTSEEFQLAGIHFTVFDLGGHQEVRRAWQDFFCKANAIVYLVDASAPDRFQESKAELDKIMSDDTLAGVPVLVLGNKIDMSGAVSELELRQAMGMTYTTGKGNVKLGHHIRPNEVFMCSVVKRQGYGEAFRWLSQYIK